MYLRTILIFLWLVSGATQIRILPNDTDPDPKHCFILIDLLGLFLLRIVINIIEGESSFHYMQKKIRLRVIK